MIYAGIGSRRTPDGTLQDMLDIGYQLASSGWTLRSGGAEGADTAFEQGAGSSANSKMEIFIPWEGFNSCWSNKNDKYVNVVDASINKQAQAIAAQFHPNWNACSSGARRLHSRNVFQVLGADLETPASLIICWTPAGRGEGGTGQALRIAKHYGIPICDLALPYALEDVAHRTEQIEKAFKA